MKIIKIFFAENLLLKTKFFRDKLKENFGEKLETEIVGISTVGDKILNVALSKIGEKSSQKS